MKRLLVLLTVLVFSNLSHQTTQRLSGVVLPTKYDLSINLTKEDIKNDVFSGEVTIYVKIINDIPADEDKSFQFHAKNLKFTSCELFNDDEPIEATFTDIDPETEMVTVIPTSKITAGDKYKLVISYTGILNNKERTGFYKSSYIDLLNNEEFVLATQFEEIHARKAFPCFDEPQMKAQLALNLCYPRRYHAHSYRFGSEKANPDSSSCFSIKVINAPYKYSTYQYSFLLAPYWSTGTKPDKLDIEILSSALPLIGTSQNLSLVVAPQLVDFMQGLTGVEFYNIMSNGLNVAVVPDFAAGGMENIGLIMLREEYVLWDENSATALDQQKVVTSLAHEISHQWFGNYVTMKWWNEMYLKEGFATYFEYYAADSVFPDWDLPKQFVLEQLQSALLKDSLNSLPLSYGNDDADFQNRINDVSYNKGSSVLRMIRHFMGSESFHAGLADFISENPYGSVTSDDLWSALQTHATSLPAKISEIMDNWITKPHYPLIHAELKDSKVVLTQEAFNLMDETDKTEWYIPITYATKSEPKFSNTTTRYWMEPKQNLTIGLDDDGDWFILNNQAVGLYRVNYDNKLLERISKMLETKPHEIDEVSRAQLIDDLFNLAKSGRKSYAEIFKFLNFLKQDTSYYSWYSALRNFDSLLVATSDSATIDILKDFLLDHIEYFINQTIPLSTRIPPTQVYSLQSMLAGQWACRLNIERFTQFFLNIFKTFKETGEKPVASRRAVVYCNALKSPDYEIEGYQFLWNIYKNSQPRIASERVTILESLACTSNDGLKRDLLQKTLTQDIYLQHAQKVYSSVYSSEGGLEITLNFIIDHYKDIIDHFGSESTLISLIRDVSQRFTTDYEISRLEDFGNEGELSQKVKTVIRDALDAARENLKFTERLEKDMQSLSGGATANKLTFVLLFSVLFIIKWLN